VEFVDTNVLAYAHDTSAGSKYDASKNLIFRLSEQGQGCVSIQVLCELYSVATRKLRFKGEEAEQIIGDFGAWFIHRPTHASLLNAARLERRYRIAWWDALVLNSALEAGCTTLWTEDFTDGQRFSSLRVRNPFV